MDPLQINLGIWLLAALPVIVVLVLMVGFRWGGAKAGPAGWITALILATTVFRADTTILGYSQMKALLLTMFVLYIIWMALLLYNIVQEAGAISVIGQGVINLTGNRVLQLLALGWVFSSFLQGVAGFGVPIAVVAPLLIGLGFSPITSVAAAAIGHSWSVTFGDIAASFNAMIAVTGLPGENLAPWSATLLGVACFLCGIAVAFIHDGLRALRQSWLSLLIVGTVMAGTQYLLATNGLWNLAGFAAGLAGLVAIIPVTRLYRRDIRVNNAIESDVEDDSVNTRRMSIGLAVMPYILLVAIVTLAELVPGVHEILNRVKIVVDFPPTQTALGWVNDAGKGKVISVFGHAGALLFYTSILSYFLFAYSGHLSVGALPKIISNTVKSAVPSSIGIASMVGFAITMEMSGMVNLLAIGISQTVQVLFPLLSPFIGLLGAFMTGSNTNSNVLFASLQKQTAELLALPTALILAAQTTGGSLGSMLAPAKIIVGCSTAGLEGKEGQVLRITITVGVIITVIIGVIVLILSRWI